MKSLGGLDGALTIYFFMEFSKSVDIEYSLPVQIRESRSTGDIPYQTSELASCERLLRLNRELRSRTRADRVDWMMGMAEVAVRFECLDTAAALVRLLSPKWRGLQRDLRRRFLSLFAALGFAEGRHDDVADILLADMELTHSNDDLFTALSLCLSDDSAGYFDTLPSGKVNRAYLSKRGVPWKALQLLSKSASEPVDLQTQLLAASLLRTASPSLYLETLNRFLGHYGLGPLRRAGTGGPNALQSLSFVAPQKRPSGPKVSVIMAVYNSAQTVSYAIRSITEQNYQNFELLICDDCSTDGSAEEIAKWLHDSRIVAYRSNARQGPYNIRNGLIAEASGAYITFQDADDVAHPERLSRQVDALDGSSASASYARWLRIRPDGAIVFFRDHQCVRMSTVSLMMRAEIFKTYGPYRTVLFGADFDLLDRLRIELGPEGVIELEVPLLFGLWSSNSITRQPG